MALKDLIRKVHGPSTLSTSIDIHLMKDETLPDNREIGWHVSSFAGNCERAIVLYKLLRSKKNSSVSPQTRKIWDVGSALHHWYQNYYLGPMGILWGKWRCSRCHGVVWGFMPTQRHNCEPSRETWICKKLCNRNSIGKHDEDFVQSRGGCIHCSLWGRWEYKEVPVRYFDPDTMYLPIVGHSDGLIYLGGIWYIIEIKTRRDPMFQFTTKADVAHEAQGKVYGYLIRNGHVRGLPEGVKCPRPLKLMNMYVAKNISEEKEFVCDLDDNEGEDLLSKPKMIESAIVERSLPVRRESCDNLLAPTVKKCGIGTLCYGKKTISRVNKLRKIEGVFSMSIEQKKELFLM
jgi:hypothetical protein